MAPISSTLSAGLASVFSFIFHPLVTGSVVAFAKYGPIDIVAPYISSPALGKLSIFCSIAFGFGLVSKVNSYLSWGAENNWVRDKYDWKKEIVLITGASSGYGERMTELLAQRGIKVITLSRSPLKPEIAAYKNVYWYQCDVCDYDRVTAVASQIRQEHGSPTVLVNNAAIASKNFILEENIRDVQKLVNINLVSQWKMIQEFLPAMIERNHGHVICIASLTSFISIGGLGKYCSTKHGLVALHETLRQELRHVYKANKVRTSIINPGWTMTPMTEKDWVPALKRNGTPIMKTDDVVVPIVNIILGGYSKGPVILPRMLQPLTTLSGWPTWANELMMNYVQV